MLLNLREYHRISSREPRQTALDQALGLLARNNLHTVPLAGGGSLLGSADPAVEAVVDLQNLGLDGIELQDGVLHIGAMVTRSTLAQEQRAGFYDGLLCRAAHHWSGSVQRNRATVGGALAVAAPDDPLIAALLAADARVVLYGGDGYRELPLVDFLLDRAGLLAAPALIVELAVVVPPAGAGAGLAWVARTPSDAPIVVVAATLEMRGDLCTGARLALNGVAAEAIRLPAVEEMLIGQPLSAEQISAAAARAGELVDPPGDFRGSAEYRRAMAVVLSRRALYEARTAHTDRSKRAGA